MTHNNVNSAEHRPIFPFADCDHIARRDRGWTALRALAGSAEDSGEALHADGHRIRGHAGPADDHSAPAVLCEDTEWVGDQPPGMAYWNRNHHGFDGHFLHSSASFECADVGTVFRSSGTTAGAPHCPGRIGNCVSDFRLRHLVVLVVSLAPRTGCRWWHRRCHSSLRR